MSEQSLEGSVAAAVSAFRSGDPVLIHDFADREGETDILYPAASVDAEAIARMRLDGGGLIFVAVSDAVARAFDLPFLHEVIDHPATDHADLGYDAHPSFSLTVNHRDTYTGVTDSDRARTVSALGAAAADVEETDFAAEFRTPGHVHVLRAAPGLLADRQGHTELGLALAAAADQPPAVAGCEMLDAATGDALTVEDAQAYAERTDTPLVDGATLVQEFA